MPTPESYSGMSNTKNVGIDRVKASLKKKSKKRPVPNKGSGLSGTVDINPIKR